MLAESKAIIFLWIDNGSEFDCQNVSIAKHLCCYNYSGTLSDRERL